MNNNKQSLSDVIDNIFYDLELEIHQALHTYEQDMYIIIHDTKKKLKKK